MTDLRSASAVLDDALRAQAADRLGRSGAHLAGVPFAFAGASASRALPTAEPLVPGTLAHTLSEIGTRKVALVPTSRGVRVQRLDDPALADAIDRHAPALSLWLQLGGADVIHPAPWDALGWDPAIRLRAAWFGLLFASPDEPVAVRPGVRITDWTRYRESVAARFAAGPGTPYAEDLRAELETLFARVVEAPAAVQQPGAHATIHPMSRRTAA